MIYGHIQSPESREAYDSRILKAIDYCRRTDTSHMHEGRYPMDAKEDPGYIVQICERMTGEKEEKLPEVHRIYAELQYVVSGQEYIGFYPDLGDNEILENQLEDRDTLYYKENPGVEEQMLPMTEGCYAIFFPEDVHRPFCRMGENRAIKKVVIKIRLQESDIFLI